MGTNVVLMPIPVDEPIEITISHQNLKSLGSGARPRSAPAPSWMQSKGVNVPVAPNSQALDVSTCSSRRSGVICPVDGGFGTALQPAAANKRAAAIAGPVRVLNFIAL
tara:strand:+ start:4254 stop:4577 length:324 start_codon:yes stop_codon:yes gene_type:complete